MNKKFLKTVACAAAAAMLTGMLGGCGQGDAAGTAPENGGAGASAPAGDKKVVGVILNHTQDVFMKNMERGVKEAAEQHPELEVKLVESGQDPTKQLSQVEQFVSEGVDIIVLNPTNQEASATAIDAAVEAGIPIMTFNTMSTEAAQAKCVTYVGSDAVESGRIQARYVADEVLKGEGKVAYMDALIGHQAQIDRKAGWDEIMKDYPGIEVVLEGAADFVTDKGMELTENWLQSGTEFDIIVSQGADMAYGARLALQDAGKLGEIKVSSIDITNETAELLKTGDIANLVFQDAIGQGAGAVDTAAKILAGEQVESYIDIPYELVTADNVSEYDGRY